MPTSIITLIASLTYHQAAYIAAVTEHNIMVKSEKSAMPSSPGSPRDQSMAAPSSADTQDPPPASTSAPRRSERTRNLTPRAKELLGLSNLVKSTAAASSPRPRDSPQASDPVPSPSQSTTTITPLALHHLERAHSLLGRANEFSFAEQESPKARDTLGKIWILRDFKDKHLQDFSKAEQRRAGEISVTMDWIKTIIELENANAPADAATEVYYEETRQLVREVRQTLNPVLAREEVKKAIAAMQGPVDCAEELEAEMDE
ncbi:hypothetical protein LTR22_022844 [Elasticomyces elasticus]|nr:hypothetical protein LTR22_022844 [Elasticomyces elasticus]KAK4928501.1 hypothetical protein LTR49_004908 [Elasticomyces elasticus]